MKHLLSIDDLARDDLVELLDLAEQFDTVQQRQVRKVPALRGRTVVLAFFEDSTRTRTSFDLAARRLSADVVNFAAGSSSLKKGESLRDTIETITAMGVDGIVVRHGSSGAPHQISRWTDASVVNAGDGWHQHPTQALLDSFTLRRRLGDLEGRRIVLCGDILHSRVARSDIAAFTTLGAHVTVCAPATMLPPTIGRWPVTVERSLDRALDGADAAYFLRIQLERQGGNLVPSLREYRTVYGLTVERAARLGDGAVIMHPGPMNRGVEIDPEVADDPRSAVIDQVANGVAVRMAVLFRTLGPGRFDGADPDATAGEVAADTGSGHRADHTTSPDSTLEELPT
ncbi:MAG: aspartate carbamoyltransferase catalytic subunit [Acidimicrobiales bacterium]